MRCVTIDERLRYTDVLSRPTDMASIADPPSGDLRRSKRNKFHLDVAGLHRVGSHSATGCAVEEGFPASSGSAQKRRHSGAKTNGAANTSRRSEPTPPLKKSKLENQRTTPERPHRRERKAPARHSDFVTNTIKVEDGPSEPATDAKEPKQEVEGVEEDPPRLEAEMGAFPSDTPAEAATEAATTPAEAATIPTEDAVTPSAPSVASTSASPSGIVFECMKCPAHFDTRNGLTNHVRLHGKGREFACDLCDFSCTNMKTLRIHRQVHGPMSLQAKAEQHAQNAEDWQAKQIPKIDAIDKALNLGRAEEFDEVKAEMDDESVAPEQSAQEPSAEENNIDEEEPEVGEGEEHEEDAHEDEEMETESPKLGRPKSKRKMLQCSLCPYTTRHYDRYANHNRGHQRKSGYKCPLCSFMSSSSGFLKRHCDCHKVTDYPWPPVFVNADGTEQDDKVAVPKENEHVEDDEESHQEVSAPAKTGQMSLRQRRSAPSKLEDEYYVDMSDDYEETEEPKQSTYTCTFQPCPFSSNFKNSLFRHIRRKHADQQHSSPLDEPPLVTATEQPSSSTLKKYSDLVKILEASATASVPVTPAREDNDKKVKKAPQTMFVCESCPFATTIKSELVTHELGHNANLDYRCPDCSFSAATIPILHEHQRVHVNVSRSPVKPSGAAERFEKCPECPYQSKHTCDMKAHRDMHIGKREFACNRCTYSTKRNHVLIQHIEMHEKDDKRIVEEEKAEVVVEAVPEVEVKEPEPEEEKDVDKSMSVPMAPAQFAVILEEKTQNEIGAIYSEDGGHRFHCSICQIDEGSHEIYYEHTRQHTDDSVIFSCTICHFQTDNGQTIIDHEDVHPQPSISVVPASSNGVFQCRECPFKNDNYSRMWHHNQKHKKPGKYRCEKCSFQTGLSHVLRDHLWVHEDSYTGNFGSSDHQHGRSSSILPATVNNYHPSVHKETEGHTPKEEVMEPSAKRRRNGLHMSASSGMITSCPSTPPAISKQAGGGMRKNDSVVSLPTYGNEEKAEEDTFDPKNLYKNVFARGKRKALDKTVKMRQCTECPYEAENETVFELHLEMHLGHRPHKCSICSYSCFGPESLYTHLNLHAPQISSEAASVMRRYISERRRNGTVSVEKIPIGAKNVFNCRQCNYRTLDAERFQKHQTEHVLLIQQRLMTAIKRANAEEPVKVAKRPRRPSDKMLYCPKCSFKSDTPISYTEHFERHGVGNTVYSCSVCDYGDNTQQVVVFHERNHHYDTPLTHFYKSGLLKDAAEIEDENDLLRTVRYGNKVICCKRCSEFKCHELNQLVRHWETSHVDTEEDRQRLEELKLGLVPRSTVARI
uniref:C2H2-type domain-containing protein n=1 Tax=Steinernema glaseri TaxID=37863 RepID=A0A1I8A1U5_9BILA